MFGSSTLTVIGLGLTALLWLLGKFLANLNSKISAIAKANERTNQRIEKAEENAKENLRLSCDGAHQQINATKGDLDNRMQYIERTVIFKDHFSQYKETQDTKFASLERIMAMYADQQRIAAQSTSEDLKRIAEKMDALPHMLREDVRQTFALMKRGD